MSRHWCGFHWGGRNGSRCDIGTSSNCDNLRNCAGSCSSSGSSEIRNGHVSGVCCADIYCCMRWSVVGICHCHTCSV